MKPDNAWTAFCIGVLLLIATFFAGFALHLYARVFMWGWNIWNTL